MANQEDLQRRVDALEKLFIDHAHNNTPQVGGQISYNDLDSPPALTNLPSDGEKDALAGSSGTPSSSNTYITEDDATVIATASKVVRRGSSGEITVPATPTNSTDSASKGYTDTVNLYATVSSNTQFSDDTETDLGSGTVVAKYAQVKVPGRVRLSTSFKIDGGSGPASIEFLIIRDDLDGIGTVGADDIIFYSNASFSGTSYTNINESVYVRAGDIIGIAGVSSSGTLKNENFRIQFDINTETSAYGEVLS